LAGHQHRYLQALSSESFGSVKLPTYGGEPISMADRWHALPMAGSRCS
jgi:hypothetical protein